MAEPKKPDQRSEGILAMIDAQIAGLQATRENILHLMSLGIVLGGDGDLAAFSPSATSQPRGPIELPVGAFRNKSIPDAIKLFLSAARQKQTIRQIAEGLREGGLESTSRRFETTVTGALYRLYTAGVVLKFKDGRWDLAESYPEHIRKSVTADSKKVQKATRKQRTKPAGHGRVRHDKSGTGSRRKSTDQPVSTSDRILAILAGGSAASADITARLGLPSNVVGLALGRLAKYGQIEKLSSGQFALKATDQPRLKAV